MQEKMKQLYDSYGIDAKNLSNILNIEKETIEQDRCNEQERRRLYSLINGFSIMEYQVENDDILRSIMEEMIQRYGITMKSLSGMIHVNEADLDAFYHQKEIPMEIKYTISCQLFRLGNAVFPLDEKHGV